MKITQHTYELTQCARTALGLALSFAHFALPPSSSCCLEWRRMREVEEGRQLLYFSPEFRLMLPGFDAYLQTLGNWLTGSKIY